MLRIVSIIVLCAVYMIVNVDANARLMDPPARGSAWRLPEFAGKGFPINEVDQEWCFDPLDKFPYQRQRNASCGICGPIYNGNPTNSITIVKKGDVSILTFVRLS